MKEKLSCKAISGQQYFGVKLFQYIWYENIIYSKTVKLFQDELIFLSSYFRIRHRFNLDTEPNRIDFD